MEKVVSEIDISIVTYNSSQWIPRFLESLIKQSYPTEQINLLFTDHESTDLTPHLLLEWKSKLEKRFKSFKVVSEKNLGFGHGHNNNIFNSSSEFILVTNIDLEFETDTITTLINTAVKDDLNVASWECRQKPFEHPKHYNPVTLETTWSSSACVLFRRTAFQAVGGYEKKIFMYGEDVELSFRLRDNGYKLKYCPKAVCWHYAYEYENQIKPLQFFGSILANCYIRLRYGRFKNIIGGLYYYLSLLSSPENFPNQRIGLVKNFFKLLINTPYFLATRKRSAETFKFYLWDYEIFREGAFYKYKKSAKIEDKISVIVRTYGDRLDFLQQAVASIGNQTHANIEIIVVEDGTRNAAEYIKSIQYDNIKSVIYQPVEKCGRCKAGNVGLSLATGKYIAFLDDDDLYYPDHLEILLYELVNNSDVAAVYASAFEVKTLIKSWHPLTYQELSYKILHKQCFSRVIMWCCNYIPIQANLFKRELYDQYGGFDEEMDYLEDWNLWTRYSLHHDFRFIDKTTSLYRVPGESEVAEARQKKLDDYYQIAVEKQRQLIVQTTPAKIIEYCDELHRHLIKGDAH
jgi:GT2 family glycosyltransferase